jgi:hypothetical protein
MSRVAVIRLHDVHMSDGAEVGGKAASLGELLATGVRVPDGVALTAAAAHRTPDDGRSLLDAGGVGAIVRYRRHDRFATKWHGDPCPTTRMREQPRWEGQTRLATGALPMVVSRYEGQC